MEAEAISQVDPAVDERRNRFTEIFRRVLGRSPDQGTIDHHMALMDNDLSLADICLGLVESDESRFRTGPRQPADPTSVMIVIITCSMDPEFLDVLKDLTGTGPPNYDVVLIDRSHGGLAGVDMPRLTIMRRPGSTVFQCRMELCGLGQDHAWMLLLEDHNFPVDDWMRVVGETIATTKDDVDFICGAVDNRRSDSFWSWCSYLVTFSEHWPPMQATRAIPGIANVVLRRANLPKGPYNLGQFELEILPQLARAGAVAPNLTIDHFQPVSFYEALRTHMRNARVIGAMSRRYIDDPVAHIAAVRPDFLHKRPKGIDAIIGRGVRSGSTMMLRLGTRLILIASFLAYAFGIVLGPGKGAYDVD